MSFNINSIIRPNIKSLKPYTSARDEYKGKEGVFLDANENSFGSATHTAYNRYPDPIQWEVKEKLAIIKGVKPTNILIGNGSDEPIDLLYRCFCTPGVDEVLITPPTYGMYEVSANINDIKLIKVSLTSDFQLDTNGILKAITSKTKLIFLCSPNNPTGNLLKRNDIYQILNNFNGLVVIDEAYIDFASEPSFTLELDKFPNLVVLQTFSKAWGLANLRLGIAYASEEIIDIFNKVKPPYNVNGVSQSLAIEALNNEEKKNKDVEKIITEREKLKKELLELPYVTQIYPTDANFLLVKTTNGNAVYDFLIEHKVIVRNRSNVTLCEGCIRITIGTEKENATLIEKMKIFKS